MDKTINPPSLPDLNGVDLDRIAAALAGLMQYRRISKKDIIRQQFTAIDFALRRGVGHEAIARALTESGCPVDARVLRKYTSEIRREQARALAGMALVTDVVAPPSSTESTQSHLVTAKVSDSAPPVMPGHARRSLRRSAWLQSQAGENGHAQES